MRITATPKAAAHHVPVKRLRPTPLRSKSFPTIKGFVLFFGIVYVVGALAAIRWIESNAIARRLTESQMTSVPRIICLSNDIKNIEGCTDLAFVRPTGNSQLVRPSKSSKSRRWTLDHDEEEKQIEQPDQSMCVPTESWQTTHHPSCNAFHEVDYPDAIDAHENNLARSSSDGGETEIEFKAAGGWRGVWKLSFPTSKDEPDLALRMIKWGREHHRTYTEATYRRHIVDAMATDRLSGLGIATDIYGFCGHSVLNSYGEAHLLRTIKSLNAIDKAKGFVLDWSSNNTLTARLYMTKGTPHDEQDPDHHISPGNGKIFSLWPTLKQRLEYSRDAAEVVARMRSVDYHKGDSFYNVTIVHHDIKPDNFIVAKQGLRLNDFNDARLLWFNTTSSGPCLFRCKKHNPYYQSPEEAFELPLSHAVDLHTLGGLLYFILFGKRPYFDLEEPFAFAYLTKQIFPLLPVGANIEDSGNRAVTKMLKLIRQLRSYRPSERPSASAAVAELDNVLKEL